MNPINPERWQQIESLLDQALDLPTDQRSQFLHQLGTNDPDLLQQIKAVLHASDQADDAFDTERFEELLPDLVANSEDTAPSRAGEHIGPYLLLDLLGHGGMGSVYRARRADGQFDHEVALKLIRPGLAPEERHRRFLAERQILARLRHDHIARLLDGGVSDEGQPYFVMEHIAGQRLTDYCDEHRLSVQERLRLFAQVCEAVQYAHRNLIVHRDLKPSNILVTEEGQVKLLDFGIAKLLSDDEAASTLITQTGQRVMTPEYAAPEQVRGEAITTGTDVYALGVILFELLTGHRPYQVDRRDHAELERLICEALPDRPSTAVSWTEERPHRDGTTEEITPANVSGARGTTQERLRRVLEGDLDTICLMALRKEPERRYASAEAFVEDVRRYLAGLPVQA